MSPESFYHIYNRGNNRQPIFFKRKNYLFFLKKIRKHLCEHLHIIAYCLMPNHFHLLVFAKSDFEKDKFSEDFKILLRSYTRAINNQESRTGSLFQQNSKIKPLTGSSPGSLSGESGDPFICFHYVHQNPLKARLVRDMMDWEMSSFRDYAGLRNGTLCEKEIAYELLEIPKSGKEFIKHSNQVKLID